MRSPAGPVLVVDDDADWRDLILGALAVANVPAVGCASGDDAIAVASDVCPSVVVTDLHMPGMDGARLARALRALHPAPVLLALTGDADAGQAAWPEFHAMMTKPVSPLEVAAMVVRLSRSALQPRR